MSLWDFAVGFYGRGEVSNACLFLQDNYGVDVNVLLYVLWLVNERERVVTEADVAVADGIVTDWRNTVVTPLRKVRRQLKIGPAPAPSPKSEELRSCIKTAELQAERIELETLEYHAPQKGDAGQPDADRVHTAIGSVVAHYCAATPFHHPVAACLALVRALQGYPRSSA